MKLIIRGVLIFLLFVLVAGCGDNDNTHHHSGGHVHPAPHGGTLVELGEHAFNLEFLLDRQLGTLRLYVLGAHAEKFIRIQDEKLNVILTSEGETHSITLDAMPNELTKEVKGDTSHFFGSIEWLKGKKFISGVMRSVKIQGNTYEEVSFDLPVHGEHP
ncbi:MAG: hypothetical protein HOK49_07685 [Opitutae bacterium]|jgi:hypothetical protein|nr:hypothetical protein [Opitutae bacterium]MBT5379517.1 hypothetical protein [Opitutae bacterium]MBT5691096.1 hypothetical protein [Opitutae bacterium]MBT6462404.1 hypothetical protein [Opitutae bacterium]MBT6957760.1 hypothetical protein [Opitutae bacterium]